MNANSADTDLLVTARSVLRDELLKALPDHKRYEALMVANAMAIAAREAKLGSLTVPPPQFPKSIAELLDHDGEPESVILDLIERLRSGAFNSGNTKTARLHQNLMVEAERKVRISNPRYLRS